MVITKGMIDQVISSGVEPWIGFGTKASSVRRNFTAKMIISAKISSVKTTVTATANR
jgi:hypothetical protein